MSINTTPAASSSASIMIIVGTGNNLLFEIGCDKLRAMHVDVLRMVLSTSHVHPGEVGLVIFRRIVH